jgi:hypothetical protein
LGLTVADVLLAYVMRALIQEWPDDALADGALGSVFMVGCGDFCETL